MSDMRVARELTINLVPAPNGGWIVKQPDTHVDHVCGAFSSAKEMLDELGRVLVEPGFVVYTPVSTAPDLSAMRRQRDPE